MTLRCTTCPKAERALGSWLMERRVQGVGRGSRFGWQSGPCQSRKDRAFPHGCPASQGPGPATSPAPKPFLSMSRGWAGNTRGRCYLAFPLSLGQVHLLEDQGPLLHHQGLLIRVGRDVALVLWAKEGAMSACNGGWNGGADKDQHGASLGRDQPGANQQQSFQTV